LKDVAEGQGARELRGQLLSGALDAHCRECLLTPPTTPEVLTARVTDLLQAQAPAPPAPAPTTFGQLKRRAQDLEADIVRFHGRFSYRLAAFTRFWLARVSRHGLFLPSYARLAASGLFDKTFYLAQNPDVANTGDNPLLHYFLHGAFEGRNPNPLFSSSWYIAAHPDVAAAKINPLLHYFLHGAAEGY